MQALWDGAVWVFTTLALAIAAFFWIEVADKGQAALRQNPKVSLLAFGKSALWFVFLVGVLWAVTRGG